MLMYIRYTKSLSTISIKVCKTTQKHNVGWRLADLQDDRKKNLHSKNFNQNNLLICLNQW